MEVDYTADTKDSQPSEAASLFIDGMENVTGYLSVFSQNDTDQSAASLVDHPG